MNELRDVWLHGVPRERLSDARLTGFRIGEDLMRYRSDAELAALSGLPWVMFRRYASHRAIEYNSALCRRGLDRWEDDGAPTVADADPPA